MLVSIENEFARAELGDVRRTKSVVRIARILNRCPSESFPKVTQSRAELELIYGFVENEEVSAEALLTAHRDETVHRIDEKKQPLVLVVHDSSELSYGGESIREGVGWNGHYQQGYLLHLALAVTADGLRHPLGVLGTSTIHREQEPKRNKDKKTRTVSGYESAKDPDRESLRWPVLMKETSDALRGHAIAIHIADREAESYEFFLAMFENNERFVVRARALNRLVFDSSDESKAAPKHLIVAAQTAVPVAERTVRLTSRKRSPIPKQNDRHPPRNEREARLEYGARRITLVRPRYVDKSKPKTIEINVVHVREVETPEGAEPIEWLLFTSEPIETAEDVLRVVDFYRARWIIEEFFKALKTGCSIEKRQLESFHALKIALALYIPMAWQMLLLRALSRETPDAPATNALTQERINVVNMLSHKKLPVKATVAQLFRAIAMLGGYINVKGRQPGWQTLGLGLERVFDAEDMLRKVAQAGELGERLLQAERKKLLF